MGPCQDGKGICTDLIGHISIGSDPVSAHQHHIHHAFSHTITRHIIRDQFKRDTLPEEFPGSEPGPLKPRTGFIHNHIDLLSGIPCRPNHPQCRSISSGGECPGIAMGQNCLPLLNQCISIRSNLSIDPDILMKHMLGFLFEALFDLIDGYAACSMCRGLYPFNGPGQIYCSRSRREKDLTDPVKRFIKLIRSCCLNPPCSQR